METENATNRCSESIGAGPRGPLKGCCAGGANQAWTVRLLSACRFQLQSHSIRAKILHDHLPKRASAGGTAAAKTNCRSYQGGYYRYSSESIWGRNHSPLTNHQYRGPLNGISVTDT